MALDNDVVIGPVRTDPRRGGVLDFREAVVAGGPDAVMVLGMHRSGTSAVTRALSALGLDPGADPLMAATVDNPTGHFEVGRLTGLDDEILDAVEGRWAAPPAVGADEVRALADGPLGARARRLIAEVFTDPGWVWKDPRSALLLPFWRAVLDPDPPAVVVMRHPLAVARSLVARDGMALDYGLALWERYTRTLLRDLRGMRAFVVDYDGTMARPDGVVEQLASFLMDSGLDGTEFDGEAAAKAFVGDHRHHLVDDVSSAAEPAIGAEVRSLQLLVEGVIGAHDSFPAVDLGGETPGLQTAFTEHKRLSRHEERIPVLEGEIELRDSRLGDLRAEIDRRSEQASSLAEELMAVRDERGELAARLQRLERWWVVRLARRVRRLTRRTPTPELKGD